MSGVAAPDEVAPIGTKPRSIPDAARMAAMIEPWRMVDISPGLCFSAYVIEPNKWRWQWGR
jgi:hypothetical protein